MLIGGNNQGTGPQIVRRNQNEKERKRTSRQ